MPGASFKSGHYKAAVFGGDGLHDWPEGGGHSLPFRAASPSDARMPVLRFLIISTLLHYVRAQPPPQQPANPSDVQRTFYELIQRQQQLNNAILLNNALLHNSMATALHREQLPIPLTPPEALIPPLAPNPAANLFVPFNQQRQKLEIFEKLPPAKDLTPPTTVPPPLRDATTTDKPTVAEAEGVVSGESEEEEVLEEPLVTTVSNETSQESSSRQEVSKILGKLNVSREDAQSIVDRLQELVLEQLEKKLGEVRRTPAPITTSTTTTTVTNIPTTTTTTAPSEPPTTASPLSSAEEEFRAALASLSSETDVPTSSSAEGTRVVVNRHNIKLHPVSRVAPEQDEGWGAIKTSKTHLPIVDTAEETHNAVAPVQVAPVVAAAVTTVRAGEKEKKNEHKTLLKKRISVAVQKDKDLDDDLLVDFATGAPLDLNEANNVLTTTRSRPRIPAKQILPTAATERPAPSGKNRSAAILPARHRIHEMTQFEKLATDYRRRLENTGDVNKILQKIYENAYISLVERRG
ncbi:unnamed protein product [Caenorhabditis auriculariae]|uniref:Uncharacterized protein n=1 Tax=Caenorhabditis auriculariae TaxID=2777116 RepID=A0A8S1HNI7_9PELO|nr:unnamed protein product [Caenorhabditis auriculariae]